MRFVKINFLFFVLSCLCFSKDWVIDYKGTFYDEAVFYSFFPKNEWKKLPFEKRKDVLSGFIKRQACLYEAEVIGLGLSVNLHKKLSNRFDRLLVNEYYMKSFLGGLIPERDLNFCKKNLDKDVFVKHILLPLPLNIKDTLNTTAKALLIKKQLLLGFPFDSLATLYSIDPSVSKNLGSLGWVSIGQTVPSFQNKAFSLCLGCVGVVKTGFGYHVLKVDSLRKSDYSYLKKEDYNNFAFRFASSYIKGDLSSLAAAHDSLVLKNNGFVVDKGAISSFIKNLIVLNKKNSSRSSSLFLDSLRYFGRPLLGFSSNVFSGNWLANQFEWGLYKNPFYDNESILIKEIKLVVLRSIIKKLALEGGLELSYSFVNQYNAVRGGLIEKSFLKHLKSSVVSPSEGEVKIYFNTNKGLFLNPTTKEPYILKDAYGSVEASLLKHKQDSVSSLFLNSLNLSSFVKINEVFLYEK
jgi:hypothetical protein